MNPSSFSSFLPDIVIRSPEGRFVASVEIKNVQHLTREVATKLRSNMLVDGLLTQTPYFLVVSQDKGFLWKDAWQGAPDTPPDFEFPMGTVVTRYVRRRPGERLYKGELELLLLQWLSDLAKGMHKNGEEPEITLARAGFNDSIKDATVMTEDAA